MSDFVHFVRLPDACFDATTPNAAVKIIGRIARYCIEEKRNRVQIGQRDLQKKTGIKSHNTLQRYVGWLEKRGWLRVERHKTGKGKYADMNIYSLCGEVLQVALYGIVDLPENGTSKNDVPSEIDDESTSKNDVQEGQKMTHSEAQSTSKNDAKDFNINTDTANNQYKDNDTHIPKAETDVSMDNPTPAVPVEDPDSDTDGASALTLPDGARKPTEAECTTWNAAKNQLELQLDPASFETWLHPSDFIGVGADGAFILTAQNEYGRDMLQYRLVGAIQRVLSDVIGEATAIQVVVRPPPKVTHSKPVLVNEADTAYQEWAYQQLAKELTRNAAHEKNRLNQQRREWQRRKRQGA